MLRVLSVFLLAVAGLARAGLSDMRGTIPGSLHQCQNISIFFFDTDDTGGKTLLLLSSADATTVGSGTVTLSDVLAKTTPLQTVSDITADDAQETFFFLKVAEGTSFSTYGFLSDGQGKDLGLDRTVQSPLPGATSCLSSSSASVATTKASTTSSSTSSTRFVTSVKSSTTAAAIKSTSTTTAAAIKPTINTLTTLAKASAASSTKAAAKPTSSGTVVVNATYLLTSFIDITDEKTSDGLVSSASITGGHVTGKFNGTIAPFGSVLFTSQSGSANSTTNSTIISTNTTSTSTSTSTASKNGTALPDSLLSATYSMVLGTGEIFFVVAQTPLSTNYTTEALILDIQPAFGNSTTFSNMTILGKSDLVNSTHLRIDAYRLKE